MHQNGGMPGMTIRDVIAQGKGNNYPILRLRYLNRYITINDKKTVENGCVLDDSLERLKTRYRNSWYRFAIEFVGEEKPQICLIND